MSDVPKKSAKKPGVWVAVRKSLDGWEKPALLALIKDLFDASAESRDFILARCQAENVSGPVLEKYRSRVVEPFFPKRGDAKLNLSEARKAIREFTKATGNLEGTIELLLTYVESGTDFTLEFGDIDAPFYNSLSSAMEELKKLTLDAGAEVYAKFEDRLIGLSEDADGIGWGYGDCVVGKVDFMRENFAGDSRGGEQTRK